MLHLIQSNQMELLAQKLAQLLSLDRGDSALSQEQILVQSPGMSTWLRLNIAEQNGIAAAQEFPLPSSFIWQLCYLLLDDVPKENPFTKAAMTWKLMALLPQLLSHHDFAPLRHYLGEDNPLKLYQLCGRIADIFDQYLVYRPDWILAWEQHELEAQPSIGAEHRWQPLLWRALVAYNRDVLNQSDYHRANLHQALIGALCAGKSRHKLPSRLFVFGISSMAPQTLDVIYALASNIDVYMLNLSPCQHYWGDIIDPKARARMALTYSDKKQLPALWQETLEVGNPLLANNGKMGREMLDMLLELPPTHIQWHEAFACANDDTLLSGIQNDILDMSTLGVSLGPELEQYLNIKQRRGLAQDDDSICLRSCHSPLREIETLHDHLLAQLDKHPKLSPRDIVVMLPDVAAYAPYIDAVFGAKQGNHYIPYAIADRGAAQESPLINSFLNLLQLDNSRFGLTDIISMLEVPAVMRRFDIHEEELEQLKLWLQNAGVRWGRDAHNRAQLGLPAFDKHSWAFGIRRMILGYALGDDAGVYLGDLPVAGIEGQNAQSLGKLLDFIEVLDGFRQQMSQEASVNTRIEILNQLPQSIYLSDDDDNQDLNLIQTALTTFDEQLSQSGFDGAMPLAVICQWFTSQLTESRVGQRYLAGSVNFCTLMPMRSIPFKHVCLLGMNDGVYPRIQHPVGFDLMAHLGPRRGDRSRRLDDRYLFLEALLSARQQLYICFIGHSERDNSERISSMLVSELIEYCQLCYRPAAMTPSLTDDVAILAHEGHQAAQALLQQLLIEQPLQPFDAKLFEKNNQQSYAAQWCPVPLLEPVSPAFVSEPIIQAQVDVTTTIELATLIRFFRNPAQYFFQYSLKVDLRVDIDRQSNDEPFELNPLQRYQVQQQLLDNALGNDRGQIEMALIDELKAAGQLPMAPFDELTLSQYRRDIAALIERCLFLRGQVAPPTPVEIELDCQGITLVGRIDDVYPKGLINVRPGTTKPKDLMRLYLRHLCLNASGKALPSYLLDAGHFHCLHPVAQDQALNLLIELITCFTAGLQRPLMFMAQTSLAYQEADSELDHQQKLAEIAAIWLNDSGFGDGADPHNARLFSFPDDFSDHQDDIWCFSQVAHRIYQPMLSIYHKDPLSKLQDFVMGANT
ncbi:exodeoxyribonuclease V subunit gamma [Shewanella sp. NIFS-20-20]|uniref:exodeoxyribonuclease V subunit gamma n=1 Tax=Shewanella sp. NIFS-20-20 TaxID=2853806 RepID=UPI001C43AC37|nr:exodeoxyribonuclease V subunit gamma [Shewanella sp. NIFS-20-20]MBV7315078.1 exodeoxyribonuclease V subunit gamma [Shewanella sp. NIFS-20-20]